MQFSDGRDVRVLAQEIVGQRVADACAVGWARLEGNVWRQEHAGALAGPRHDEERGVPLDTTVDADAVVFDLASLTKPMVAVAVAKGGIDLRTPLHEVLIEARGTRSEQTTLEALLSHRSGLEANLPLFRWLRGEESPSASRPRPERSEVLARAADARRDGCRGEIPVDGFDALYSDLGYVLAGEAIARAMGFVDAGAMTSSLLVEPLALTREVGTVDALTRCGVDVHGRCAPTEVVAWRGGVVRGEVHDENAWLLTGRGGSGHAGLFGTIGGVLAFGKHVIEQAAALSATWKPRPGGTLRCGFDGRSLEGSSAGTVLGPHAFGHLGFTGTSVWLDLDTRTVVAMLTNRVYPTRENTTPIRVARPFAHDALARMALGATLGATSGATSGSPGAFKHR